MEAAIAYARNSYGRTDHTEEEQRAFELGARRMLAYLYAISTVPEERAKSRAALLALDSEDLALSVQVLQEFYVQATRGAELQRLSHDQATLLIESFLRFPVQEMTLKLLKAALATKERFRISNWDAAIIEAAREIGCDTILSEDLNDGQDYGGVKVSNPFRKTLPRG